MRADDAIELYRGISSDVWKVFKKYVPEGADILDFPKDVHALDNKYKDQAGYRFMQKLLKVYFDELNKIKGEHHEVIDKS